MWIRNQGRELIIEVDHVFVSTNTICTADNIGDITIGIYKSNERAVEVIDKIHAHINNSAYDEARGNPFAKVFQMPKE